MDRGAWLATVHGVPKSRTWLSDFHFHFQKGNNSINKLLIGYMMCTISFNPARDPHELGALLIPIFQELLSRACYEELSLSQRLPCTRFHIEHFPCKAVLMLRWCS